MVIMKEYRIKPLEWKDYGEYSTFVRLKSSTDGYYRYEIIRFINPSNNEWSDWRLDISLGNKMFYPKFSGPLSSAKYKSLEEAEEVANRHHVEFVRGFLVEV